MKKYPIYLDMQQIKVLKDIFDNAFNEADAFNEAIELNNLDTRTRNCMRYEKIETYWDLSQWEKNELLRTPNFGQHSLQLLQSHVKQKFPNRWKEFKFLKDQW
jgi:DNA-directed RNA polymerase alpha subunit